MIQKLCPKCGEWHPLHMYSNRPDSRDGKRHTCKLCLRVETRTRKYGLNENHYHRNLESQGGVCAVCHQEKPLVVDHNHKTGRVRGLLCTQCNTGLGMLGDNIETLGSAIGYLIHNGSECN